MDFSKLDQNEKLAVYGAVASVVGPIIATAGFGFGVGWLTLILALAMLAVVFLPQLSPQTTLPGSKGSLMLVVGGIAALFAVLSLLSGFSFIGLLGFSAVFVIGWLLGIAGGLLMGWAGWQEFQAEGGKFQIGSAPPSSPPAAPPPPAETTEAAAPEAPPPPPSPTAPSAPVSPAPDTMGTPRTGAPDEMPPEGEEERRDQP